MGIDKVHFGNSKIYLLEKNSTIGRISTPGICAKLREIYGNFLRKFKKEEMVPDECWCKT